MQRCRGLGWTLQQVGQGPRKTQMAKKTPASSLFLDVSLRPGPWVRGVPWGPEEAVPGVPHFMPRPLPCNTQGLDC